MDQNYSCRNANHQCSTKKADSSPFFASAKKKQHKTQVLFSFLSLIIMLFFGNKMIGQTSTFTSSGTWVCPQGVTTIQVEAYGPGGGGGYGGGTNMYGGGGGGGGAYTKNTTVAVTAGTSYTITLGTIGTAGTSGTPNGGNATATTATFGGTTITANGGFGGLSYTNGRTGGSGGAAGTFAGGNGGTGLTTGSGGGGGAAGTTSNGGNGAVPTAGTKGTGGTIAGNGGTGSTSNTAVGTIGANYGGGGGGGTRNSIGAAGAGGYVLLTFTCPAETANAGSNQTLAACATTTTLAGNTPVYGTGTWSVISGTATITTPSSPTSGVTGLSLGTTATLRWTISNGTCGSTTSDIIITTIRGIGCWNYCASTYTTGTSYYLSNVTFAGINNNSTNTEGLPMYADYTSQTGTVLAGSSYTFSGTITTGSNGATVYVWIDWNNDGTFNNSDYPTGERYTIGACGASSTNCPVSATIAVPAGAVINNTRMRVSMHRTLDAGIGVACQTTLLYGETEGYTINVIAPIACVTPTAQPTALSLTPTGNTIGGSFILASPVADNYLVMINTTGIAPTPVNGTTYSAGNTIGSSTVVDIDSNTTFTATGLSGLTTYYIYVFSFNSMCTGGPLYYTTSPLNGSSTTLTPTYCTPTGNLNCTASDQINNVTINTLNNTSTCGSGGYTNYSATGTQTTSLLKGSTYNFDLSVGTGTGTHGAGVWLDFNQNGIFSDAGEFFLISNAISPSTTTTISIPIPIGAIAGTTIMRVRYAYNITVTSGMSCTMAGTYGETEDYTLTFTDPPPCASPTAQPTALTLNPTGSTIAGAFTFASPASDNYLVVINTTGTTPSPIDGTTYAIGGTVGAGNTVVDIDSTNAFTATGLSTSTTYYLFVFSSNSLCTGGPLYISASPLNGNATTTTVSYCAVTSDVSTRYINSIQTVGNLTNMTNLNTGRSASGYADYTALPTTTQIPGGGINLDITLAISRQYLKAWVDWNNDGTFTDAAPELVYTSNGVQSIATSFGFVVPLGTATGNYRLRIRAYEASQTYTPCGNLATGETEDYKITVVPDCPALITGVTDNSRCESGTVNLSATASGSPTEFRWYSALTGGSLIGTSATGSWNTPVLGNTTNYYVTAFNGTCESLIRTKIIAKINLSSIINVTPSVPEVCGEGNVVSIIATGDTMVDDLINENFQGGLGSFTSIIIGGAGDASTQWQSKTSTFVPTLSVWKPAINSRSIGDKFAYTTSDKNLLVNLSLQSANFNTTPYSDLTLTFRQYYSYYGFPTDYAYVEVSTNNGSSWTAVRTYVEDHAIATDFENVTVDLTSYINNANFKIRFRYNAQFCDGWAIDDVRLFGTKLMNTTFSWSGGTVDAYTDLACTIPYVAQSVTTVYVKPNAAQLASASWSFTATATLSNGCPVSKLIDVYNKTKIWQGESNDWSDPNNWSPAGIPSATDCVIIDPHTYSSDILSSGYQAYGKTLTVKSGGILNALPDTNITITDLVDIKTGGVFNLKNNGSLIQINNVANTVSGTFNMERITQPMYRLDYTYWGSPVASGFTLGNLSSGSTYRYTWTPSVGGVSGNWIYAAAGTTMTAGKGYIVRAPDTFSSNSATKVPYTANFIGTPNNGDILTPITYGTMGGAATDDKWNLIANPYPSAINANTFLSLASNASIIGGTIYFWTHNTPPAVAFPDPFYGDFVTNYTATDYASWNKLGGTGTVALSGGPTPTGYIAAGSAFFVKSSAVAGNATFSNNMRVTNNNNQFFRSANITTAPNTIDATGNDLEKHRIWLNLTNNSGAFSQILVGYVQGGTLGMDRDFDGTRFGGNGVTFYSILPEANLGIQGRPLPFDENDQVILGYNSTTTGTFSVRIDHIDGLFGTQNIYLEDRLLHVTHNLKLAPYVFSTASGNFNDRFVLRYMENTLGTDSFDLTNTVKVTANEKVMVRSSNQPIKNIDIFDLLGRKIDSYKNVDANQFTLNHLNKTTNVLIVKITLVNYVVVTEKIIY